MPDGRRQATFKSWTVVAHLYKDAQGFHSRRVEDALRRSTIVRRRSIWIGDKPCTSAAIRGGTARFTELAARWTAAEATLQNSEERRSIPRRQSSLDGGRL